MWTKKNIPELSGKTALVTGANAGIGFETARSLFEAGATVVMASRDAHKANEATDRIKAESSGQGKLESGVLNLASLAQIDFFANEVKQKHGRLDILINNAGVMIPPASKTDDGFELQFGVNFLGHFALTAHLFSILADDARIVTVTSGAATLASGIDFENLKLEKPYDPWREYAVSKLANIIFTYELNRKLEQIGTIVSVAAHPGVTRTDLQRHIDPEVLEGMFAQYPQVMQPWQGALPTLFAATDPSVKGGEFYGPDGNNEYWGYPALSKHDTDAMHDLTLASQLWKTAETAIGLKLL